MAVYVLDNGEFTQDADRAERFLSNPPLLLACDTETVSLENRTLLGASIASSQHFALYVTEDDVLFPKMIRIFQSVGIKKIWHNGSFDHRVLRKYNPDLTNVQDTAYLARLALLPAVLEELSELLDFPVPSMSTVLKQYKVKATNKLPAEVLAHKACTDVQATFVVYEKLIHEVDQQYYQELLDLLPILETVSRKGVALDKDKVKILYDKYYADFTYYKVQADAMDFNPGSSFQVAYVLGSRGVFLPTNRNKSGQSTDAKVLMRIKDPVAALTLLYRNSQTMLSRYLKPWLGQDRAYTTYHLDALTMRVSATSAGDAEPDRNLANVPKLAAFRELFIPDGPSYRFTKFDASQIELRWLAYLSKDPLMLKILNDPHGDIHGTTEYGIWGTRGPNRKVAKTFNFAMIYGADAQTVADQVLAQSGLNLKTTDVAVWMAKWKETYPVAASWMRTQIEEGIANGYVTTGRGRKILIPTESGYKHAANCCLNFPCQGSAGESFRSMIRVMADRGYIENMRLFIHDEIVNQDEIQIPREELEHVSPLWTPVESTFSSTWAG